MKLSAGGDLSVEMVLCVNVLMNNLCGGIDGHVVSCPTDTAQAVAQPETQCARTWLFTMMTLAILFLHHKNCWFALLC